MQIGATIFATDQSWSIAELAPELERRGYTSLWVPEHTHIPTSRLTPPPSGQAELPEEYRRTLDPMVSLTVAAAHTTTLRIGTGIALVAQRDPIVFAKAIATLDMVSNGRFDCGVGFGWNADEIGHHGTNPAERREVVADRVAAMRALWADDVAEHAGPYVTFSPSWAWPKPIQRPGPPVLLGGGSGPKLWRHLIEWADGWLPIGGTGLKDDLPRLAADLEAAGRDPETFRTVPFGTIPDAEKLDFYGSLGLNEVVLRIPSAGRDAVMATLDGYQEFLDN